jgi:hypothetical protein
MVTWPRPVLGGGATGLVLDACEAVKVYIIFPRQNFSEELTVALNTRISPEKTDVSHSQTRQIYQVIS